MRGANDMLLFNEQELRVLMTRREASVYSAVEAVDAEKMKSGNLAEIATQLASQHALTAPRLLEDKVTVEQQEAQVDVRGDPNFMLFDRSRPAYKPGTQISFFVPFEGNPELFSARPSRWSSNPPRARVENRELVVSRQGISLNAEQVKASFQQELANIKQWLEWIEQDVSSFNRELHAKVYQRLEARRERLKNAQGVVESLGFPTRKR